MKQRYYQSINPHGLHKVAYTEWGTPQVRPVICVHGLNRNSRDFDPLAKALMEQGRWVICPDLPGRGLSDWLSKPEFYSYEQYLQDLVCLIARLDVSAVDWIGTSLGGILGIAIASMEQSPIKNLVINDIGPDIPEKGLVRLQANAKLRPSHFSSIEAAEKYLRQVSATFGKLTDQDWRAMTKTSIKPNRQGGYQFHSDPAISPPIAKQESQDLMWQLWQKITCPTLVLQGEESDFLSAETLAKMKNLHRKMDAVTFPEVGHAPALRSQDQIQVICEWLKKNFN